MLRWVRLNPQSRQGSTLGPLLFLVVERLFVRGQIMQLCHSLRCKLLAKNIESLGTSFLQTTKVERAILVLVVRFCESIKSFERYEFYCCGDVQVTTAQPERSENCYKSKSRSGIVFTQVYQTFRSFFSWLKNLMAFLSLSLLVESKVSLRQPVSVLYCFMYTLKSWRCLCL